MDERSVGRVDLRFFSPTSSSPLHDGPLPSLTCPANQLKTLLCGSSERWTYSTRSIGTGSLAPPPAVLGEASRDNSVWVDFKVAARRLKERAGEEAQNSEMRKVFCDCLFLWLWSPSFISLAPSADLPADLTSFHPGSLAPFPGNFAQVEGASTRLSACVIPPLMSRGGWQNSSPVVSCMRVQMCSSSCSNMDKFVAATLFLVLLYAVANPCCGKGYESVNRIMFSL